MAAEDRNGEVSTQGERTEPTTREHSFDTLTRGLANGSISRRKALRVLGTSLVGSVMAAIPGAAIAAPPPTTCLKESKPCKTNTDCCSQNCETRNGKLVCGPAVQCTGQGQGNCPQPASQCLQVLCSASGFCGAAQPKPNNTRCDLDNNPCTEDTCQSGVCTPGPQKTCPASTDPCKVNVCNPATGNCVTQNAPNDTPCEDGNLCTVGDTCQGGQCQAGPVKTCAASDDPCAILVCDKTTGLCEPQPANAGKQCRPAQGECDLPAVCTGTTLGCPDNPLKAVGSVCREAAGPCDVREVCNGTSAQCPENKFLPAGTVCLEAQGPCAGPSLCSGNSAQCPDNPFLPVTTVCREAAGPCDVPEFCTGTSNQCPENKFLPAGTVCRDAQADCDIAATCTGKSAACPDNGFKANTVICRPAANECDVAEFCTGNSARCPEDGFKENGVPCNRDNDLCTQDTCQNGQCQAGPQKTCPASTDPCKVNVCNPATGDCVTQNAPNGTVCEDGNLCTIGDTCQGGQCQAGSPKTCPVSTDPCKVNVCAPVTGLCVTQNAPNGTVCNDNNLCTTGETCNNGTCQGGTGKTCPAGQTCVPATGVCQCTTGVTCGDLCCSGNQGFCCPTGTTRAGQCRANRNACNT